MKPVFLSTESQSPAAWMISECFAEIEKNMALMSLKAYTDDLDSIGIIPFCTERRFIEMYGIKERKHISWKRREADIRLYMDFEEFVHASKDKQMDICREIIINSLKTVKAKCDSKRIRFDVDRLIEDIFHENSDAFQSGVLEMITPVIDAVERALAHLKGSNISVPGIPGVILTNGRVTDFVFADSSTGYSGIAVYNTWPLDMFDDDSAEVLWEERTRLNNGNAELPTANAAYFRRYAEECAKRGILPEIWIAAEDAETMTMLQAGMFDFVGYDCVSSENVTSSCIWADGFVKKELEELGISVNESGLFSTKEDALRYAGFRRKNIENGEAWEDIGIETVAAYFCWRIML